MNKAEVRPRGWGQECVFANEPTYAGKILEFDRPNALMSMHFHVEKHETWYCLSGRFIIYWIDPVTADRNQEAFNPGDTWVNRPGEPHQLECIEPGQILEASTRDLSNDNYRVEKGDSQRTTTSVSGPDGMMFTDDPPPPPIEKMIPPLDMPAEQALADPRMVPETMRAAGFVPGCPACEYPKDPTLPHIDGGPQRAVPRISTTRYTLTCGNPDCGHIWVVKEPMAGYQTIRCPYCSTVVTTDTWQKRRALPQESSLPSSS